MLPEITIARILLTWLFVLMTIIGIMTYNESILHSNIGPSEALIIFGTTINTNSKYAAVVVLCVCNSAFRVMNLNIIHSWIINNVQDTKIYFKVNTYHAYEITAIHAVYGFVDWYFYMNIILSQIDLFMVEMVVDLTMAILTTRYYLYVKSQTQPPGVLLPDTLLPKDGKKYILTSQTDIDSIEL